MEGVISVFRSQPSQLHTTRSWDFINLLEANWDASKANINGEEVLKKAGYGKDVTVGVLDTADAEIPGTTTNTTTGKCLSGTLSPWAVRGKAVFCYGGGEQAFEVQEAGGSAAVLVNTIEVGLVGGPYLVPATLVQSHEDIATILNYTVTNKAPTATLIPPTTLLGIQPAPFMAAFTSRGPNTLQPDILKPDITAPGLNILAAWSEASSLSNERAGKYKFESGTSMSCPLSDLNYPSLAIAKVDGLLTVGRTVTNVGATTSTYSVTISQPPGYTVEITPRTLRFNALGEKQRFEITVKVETERAVKNEYAFGSFVWSDGTHHVTSPIAVSTA